MAWYSPEAWKDLCDATDDHASSYAEFVQRFERTVREFAAQGYRVVKVPVDVGLMVKWCAKHGYDLDDSKGRAAFGVALALAQAEGLDVMEMDYEDRNTVGAVMKTLRGLRYEIDIVSGDGSSAVIPAILSWRVME